LANARSRCRNAASSGRRARYRTVIRIQPIVVHLDRPSRARVRNFFAHVVERLGQAITGGEHRVGIGQRLFVRDQLADAVLLQLGFDEIDKLPRGHRV